MEAQPIQQQTPLDPNTGQVQQLPTNLTGPQPPGYDHTKDSEPILQTKKEKTLYNTSYFGLFLRNFVAGFARALGALVVYLLFLAVSGYFFQKYVWPEVQPLMESFENLSTLQSQMYGNSQDGTIQIDPELVDQVMRQLSTPSQ